ncbi:MmgE/PrpD family protein [Bordetella genomosp. 11]|uniref:2-methylcitrate dehydratase n=1 Tax=Bordetella genomosp. 11 TaxID=1416808 RepID=A0A261UZ37_9BORD|nr:MmgE/PrpD family protein [Bordetella genomosp. 11]OZI66935.1 2-methylcitrate dehydratase [Bordetella genomosp. 11]
MALNTKIDADHNAPPVTRTLAEFVVNHPSRGWSDEVDHEAHRTFMNWLGCAVGAAHHEAALAALHAVQVLKPSEQATILGRRERVDIASAALINGITSHTFDFDDTHLKTIIHPAGPVCSAVLALAELTGASGRQIIDAVVIGIDVACRIGNMVYPQHYDRGWHITGTTGGFGAAAACARLLGLSVDQTQMALGIAASQPVGLREQFGTMTKPFHPGGAARAGLMSALMAREGFTSSKRAIEAPRGFAQVASTKFDWNEITDELGKRFEISFNTYKPFACGIVIHPSIDACVQLRAKGVTPENLERIDLRVHSLVLELTGKKEPADGLQGKFSVYHGCAAGLIFGRASEDEYADDIVNRPDVVDVRRKVVATVDDAIDEASVDAVATLKDGSKVHIFVEHAIGSLQRPMSDADLEAKFSGMSDQILGADQTRDLIKACWDLGNAPDARKVAGLARAKA